MISPTQLRDLIIRPTLAALVQYGHDQAPYNDYAAVEIMMGTAMQESRLGDYLAQKKGPALGIWQMEPKTELDIWENYLAYKPALRVPIGKMTLPGIERTHQLAGNLYYACAMARVLYMRATEPLPQAGDSKAQATHYVKFYNRGGAATVDEYLENWHTLQAAIAKETP